MKRVTIYTDGGCVPNPGNGAWAAVIISGKKQEQRISGYVEQTTNNRMELTACIRALEAIGNCECRVMLHTDSKYVVHGMNGWKRNINLDLWNNLDELCRFHHVSFKWVRGHDGDENNEICDEMVRLKIQEAV